MEGVLRGYFSRRIRLIRLEDPSEFEANMMSNLLVVNELFGQAVLLVNQCPVRGHPPHVLFREVSPLCDSSPDDVLHSTPCFQERQLGQPREINGIVEKILEKNKTQQQAT